MKPDLLNITFNDGKYTLIQNGEGRVYALRHGEPWGKDLVGDNFVLSLGQEVQKLREVLQRISNMTPENPSDTDWLFDVAQDAAREALGINP